MSTAEQFDSSISSLKEGMALAEYNALREKALRGDVLVMSDPEGKPYEVPAIEHFRKLYGKDPE